MMSAVEGVERRKELKDICSSEMTQIANFAPTSLRHGVTDSLIEIFCMRYHCFTSRNNKYQTTKKSDLVKFYLINPSAAPAAVQMPQSTSSVY